MKERFQQGETLTEDDILSRIDDLLSPDAMNAKEENILHYAANNGFWKVFNASNSLLKAADGRKIVSQKNKSGSTPLHYLAVHVIDNEEKQQQINAFNMLINKGADINIQNVSGATPLHFACLNNPEIALALLGRAEVNFNVENIKGETPLHCACKKGNTEIVAALLGKEGIDISIKDRDGNSALDLTQDEKIKILFTTYIEFKEQEQAQEESQYKDNNTPPSSPRGVEAVEDFESEKQGALLNRLPLVRKTQKYEQPLSDTKALKAFLNEELKGKVLNKNLYDKYESVIKELKFVEIKATPKDKPPLTQIFGEERQSHIEEFINDYGKFSYTPVNSKGDDLGRINEIRIPKLTETGEHSTTEFEVLHLNKNGELLSYSVEINGKKVSKAFDEKNSQLDEQWLNSIDTSKIMLNQRSRESFLNSSGASISAAEGQQSSNKRTRGDYEEYHNDVAPNKQTRMEHHSLSVDEEEGKKAASRLRVEKRKESFNDEDNPKKLKKSSAVSYDEIDYLIIDLNNKIKAQGEIIAQEREKLSLLAGEKKYLEKTLKSKKINLLVKAENGLLFAENTYNLKFIHNKKQKKVDDFIEYYNEEYPVAVASVDKYKKEKEKSEKERDELIFDQKVAKLLKDEVNLGYKKEKGKFRAVSSNDLDQVYLRYREAIREELIRNREITDFSNMPVGDVINNIKKQIENIKIIIRDGVLTPLATSIPADKAVIEARKAVNEEIMRGGLKFPRNDENVSKKHTPPVRNPSVRGSAAFK